MLLQVTHVASRPPGASPGPGLDITRELRDSWGTLRVSRPAKAGWSQFWKSGSAPGMANVPDRREGRSL